MTTTAEILKRAHELHAAKMAALAPLADLVALREELRQKLAATDSAYGRTYADAEAAGWTTAELNGIGAETPERRPKGRPRKPRAARLRGDMSETGAAVPEQASSQAASSALPERAC
jgi:hypothetical protein